MSSAELNLLEGPALQPPPGVISNFTDPYDLVIVGRIVTAICVALPAVAVLLRVYYKAFITRDTGADDVTLILGFAVYVAYSAISVVLAEHGLGRHQWNIRIVDLEFLLYYIRIETSLYCVFVTLIKTSILLQILRIFCPTRKRNFLFWSCWSLIIFLALFYTAALLVTILACIPVNKYWDLAVQGGHCLDTNPLVPLSAAINAVSDAIIIVLPQKSLWSLNMPRRKKIQVSIFFLVALFALAASIARLYYSVGLVTSPDRTWNLAVVGLWTYAEIFAIIVCVCMPTLGGLYKHWSKRVGSSLRFQSVSTSSLLLKIRKKASWSSVAARTGSFVSTARSPSNADMSERKQSSAVVPIVYPSEQSFDELTRTDSPSHSSVLRTTERV